MEKEIRLKDGCTVVVRDLRENDDVFALAEYINAFIDEKAYLLVDKKLTPEEEADWLRGRMAKAGKGELIDWRVWLGGKCVGGIHAERGPWKRRDNVELGIAFSKEVRDQGLGRMLLTLMIAEAKRRWKPHNIYIGAFAKNARAIHLYKSLGFREFATFKGHNNHFGEYIDEIWMVLK